MRQPKSTAICISCGEELPRSAFARRFATTHGVTRSSGFQPRCIACQQRPRRPSPTTPVADRLWPRVDRSGGPESCWEWQGARLGPGYGVIWRDGKQDLSHRVAYELTNGPIPEGQCVLHRCDNPPCCNPAHLFLGTHRVNTQDMMAKGRDGFSGERHHQATVRDDPIVEICSRYLRGGVTRQQVADEYGVTLSALQDWLYGRSRRSAHESDAPSLPFSDRSTGTLSDT